MNWTTVCVGEKSEFGESLEFRLSKLFVVSV